jgi:hypothetical protein
MAVARYDVELLLADIKSIMTTNLNTKITAINTEKGDSLLTAIDSNAYFLQDMNQNSGIVYDPFIYYGVEDVATVSIGGHTSKQVSIPVIMVLSDVGQASSPATRLFRYWRALEEIFEEHWSDCDNNGAIKIGVKSLTPVSWQLENSAATYKCVGVLLTVGMT